MEDEMQITIETYRGVIENYENEESKDASILQKDYDSLKNQIKETDIAKQQAINASILAEDDKRELKLKLEAA